MTFRSYVLVLCATFLVLSGIHEGYARLKQVSCWSGGYALDAWMAYCNSDRFGVYDVEAVWYQTEAEVLPAIQRAKVITLTDSHLQNALSLGGASEWFAAHGYPVYMLGLPTAESAFGLKLLERFDAHPKVVIFDASPYFTGGMGAFESNLLNQPDQARERVLALKDYQDFHREFCEKWQFICGRNVSYFRSRKDGHWIFPEPSPRFLIGAAGLPNDHVQFPTSVRADELVERYPDYLKVAREFVGKLGIPANCVVITAVPSEAPKQELARYLAHALGVTLIDPNLHDMMTFDRSHLTPDSSRRWTDAFLKDLEPVLKNCGAGADAPASDSTTALAP